MPRLNLVDIQQDVESQGWKLVTQEYVNLDTEMEFYCPAKHRVYTSYKKWRNNSFCPVCLEQKNTIELKDKIPRKTKGVMRVLALDDSTSITGWCIFDDGKLIGYGKLTMGQQDVMDRIVGVRQWLISAIHNWSPDFVGIEDIQLQGGVKANVGMFKTLAHLQGVLLATLKEEKVKEVVVHSATWRADCSFRSKTRTDQKREAQKKVFEWYKENTTQDEADAICIGRYIANTYIKKNLLLSWGEV